MYLRGEDEVSNRLEVEEEDSEENVDGDSAVSWELGAGKEVNRESGANEETIMPAVDVPPSRGDMGSCRAGEVFCCCCCCTRAEGGAKVG